MSVADDTVHDRIDLVQTQWSPMQLAAGLVLVAALGFALLFLQDPLAHDSMHTFRHAAGITCH